MALPKTAAGSIDGSRPKPDAADGGAGGDSGDVDKSNGAHGADRPNGPNGADGADLSAEANLSVQANLSLDEAMARIRARRAAITGRATGESPGTITGAPGEANPANEQTAAHGKPEAGPAQSEATIQPASARTVPISSAPVSAASFGLKMMPFELSRGSIAAQKEWEKANAAQVEEATNPAPRPQGSVAGDFVRSVGHAAIQTPISGIAQLADKATGERFHLYENSKISFLHAPEAAEFGTSNYWAQQVGGAVGMLVPFAIAGKGVRAFTRAGLSEARMAQVLSQRQVLGLTMKESFLTGFANDALFRPTEEGDERPFLAARALNGLSGGITMWTLSKASVPFARKPGEVVTSRLVGLVKNPLTAGVVSGMPAGFAGAQTHAYFGNLKFDSVDSFARSATSEAKFAGLKETTESIITATVIGTGFGAWHQFKGRHQSPRKNFRWEVENRVENPQLAQSREYRVAGGERALTEAMAHLKSRGEATLTVRENLGRSKGFGRFLGMHEYGPEQRLLVQKGRPDVPINLAKASIADIIALCNLDSAWRHKAVLTGTPEAASNPIFMRAGKDRISFATEKQTVRKGESEPIHLFDETPPGSRKPMEDSWHRQLDALEQVIKDHEPVLIERGMSRQAIQEAREQIAQNKNRKDSIGPADVETLELIGAFVKEEMHAGKNPEASFSLMGDLVHQNWQLQLKALENTFTNMEKVLIERGMTKEHLAEFKEAIERAKNSREVSAADVETLTSARQFVEEAFTPNGHMESAMSLLASGVLSFEMKPFEPIARVAGETATAAGKPQIEVSLSETQTMTALPERGATTSTEPPVFDGRTISANSGETVRLDISLKGEAKPVNERVALERSNGERTAGERATAERTAGDTTHQASPPAYNPELLVRAMERLQSRNIDGNTQYSNLLRETVFNALQHETVRSGLRLGRNDLTRIVWSINTPEQARVMYKLLKENAFPEIPDGDTANLRASVLKEWTNVATEGNARAEILNLADPADIIGMLWANKRSNSQHEFKLQVNRLVDSLSVKDVELTVEQARDRMVAQGRLAASVEHVAPYLKEPLLERISKQVTTNNIKLNQRNFDILRSMTPEQMQMLGKPAFEQLVKYAVTGKRMASLPTAERLQLAEHLIEAAKPLEHKANPEIQLQVVDKLLTTDINNAEAAQVYTWLNGRDAELLRSYNKRTELAIEKAAGDDYPHIKQQLERIIDGIAREPLTPEAVSRLLNNFSPAERAQLLEILGKRSEFLTMDGLGRTFEDIAQRLEREHKEYVQRRSQGFERHALQEINVVVMGDSTVGHALAYLFRKHTGVNIKVHVMQEGMNLAELANGGQVVLFDPLNSGTARQRQQVFELQQQGRMLIPAELQSFSAGLNMFDIALAEASSRNPNGRVNGMTHLEGKMREALVESGNESAARPKPGGEPTIKELDQFWRLFSNPQTTSTELVRAKVYDYVVQSKNRNPDVDLRPSMKETVDVLANTEHVSFGDMVQQAWDLHGKLSRNASEQNRDMRFITDLDNGGSTHLVSYLYRLANGMTGKAYDGLFKPFDAAIKDVRDGRGTAKGETQGDGRNMPAKVTPGSREAAPEGVRQPAGVRQEAGREPALIYLDDYIYTGSQAKSKIGALSTRPEVVELKPQVVLGTLGYHRYGRAKFQRALAGMENKNFSVTSSKEFDSMLHRMKNQHKNLERLELITYLRQLINKDILVVEWGARRNMYVDPIAVSGVVLPYMVPNDNVGIINTFHADYMGRARATSQRKYYGAVEERVVRTDIETAGRRERKKANLPTRSDSSEGLWFGGAPKDMRELRRLIKQTEVDVIVDLTGAAYGEGNFFPYRKMINRESDRAGRGTNNRIAFENIQIPIELPRRGNADLATFVKEHPQYGSFLKDVNRFINLVDGARQQGKNVYVHCYYGQDRTGLMMALHDVIVGGKPVEYALGEWRALKKQGLDQAYQNLFRSEAEFRQLVEDYRAMEASGEFKGQETGPPRTPEKSIQQTLERITETSREANAPDFRAAAEQLKLTPDELIAQAVGEADAAGGLGQGIFYPRRPSRVQLTERLRETYAREGIPETDLSAHPLRGERVRRTLAEQIAWKSSFYDRLRTNLDKQHEAMDRYLELREEAATKMATANGIDIVEARRQIHERVKQNPQTLDPLNTAYREYNMWQQEYARQTRANQQVVNMRLQSVRNTMNEATRQAKLPNVELHAMALKRDTAGAYLFGSGIMAVDSMALLKNGPPKEFHGTLLHELSHLSQDVLVVNHAVEKVMAAKRRQSPRARPEQFTAEIQKTYQELTGYELNEGFLKRVLDMPERSLLTPAETTRAMALAKSIKDLKNNPRQPNDSVTDYLVSESMLKRLERSELATDELIATLGAESGGKLREHLFGTKEITALPPDVVSLINEYAAAQERAGNGVADYPRGVARAQLVEILRSRLEQLNLQRSVEFNDYIGRLHELEAYSIEADLLDGGS